MSTFGAYALIVVLATKEEEEKEEISPQMCYLSQAGGWCVSDVRSKRSWVRLPAGTLSSHLGQLSLPSFWGIGKSSTGLTGWGVGVKAGVCPLVSGDSITLCLCSRT